MTTRPAPNVGLLLESLQTLQGSRALYRAALRCAIEPNLRKHWMKAAAEADRRIEAVREILAALLVDHDTDTEGRRAVEVLCWSLVHAVERTVEVATPETAQRVASECVLLLETKNEMNRQMLDELVRADESAPAEALADACEDAQPVGGERFQRAASWARELFRKELGLDGVAAVRSLRSRAATAQLDDADALAESA